MSIRGPQAYQNVAERIIARWLTQGGRQDVARSEGRASMGRGVEITYAWESSRRRIKVKPDPYYGSDAAKVADRSLAFYRNDEGSYAFEAVANAATREPGWMFQSDADDLYYYYVAIAQSDEEIEALVNEPDEVLFSELLVDRDDLMILPMAPTRAWFEANFERYTPRPVLVGGASAWYRLVPRADIERTIAGTRNVGPIFRSLVP